jgi:hypothetical protein
VPQPVADPGVVGELEYLDLDATGVLEQHDPGPAPWASGAVALRLTRPVLGVHDCSLLIRALPSVHQW